MEESKEVLKIACGKRRARQRREIPLRQNLRRALRDLPKQQPATKEFEESSGAMDRRKKWVCRQTGQPKLGMACQEDYLQEGPESGKAN